MESSEHLENMAVAVYEIPAHIETLRPSRPQSDLPGVRGAQLA